MKRSEDIPNILKEHRIVPYRVTNIKTEEKEVFTSIYEVSFKVKRSIDWIRECTRKGRIINKKYKVERI